MYNNTTYNESYIQSFRYCYRLFGFRKYRENNLVVRKRNKKASLYDSLFLFLFICFPIAVAITVTAAIAVLATVTVAVAVASL